MALITKGKETIVEKEVSQLNNIPMLEVGLLLLEYQ